MQTRRAVRGLMAAVVVLGFGLALWAEEPGGEKKQESLPVKVYRVEDLFVKRDWTAKQVGLPDVLEGLRGRYGSVFGMTGEGDEGFGSAKPDKKPKFGPEELVEIVKRTVNSATDRRVAKWSDEEGGPAVIESMAIADAAYLIVAQTREGLEKTEDLLDQLRAESDVGGPVLTIHAQWVEVDEGKAPQFVGRDPKRRVPLEIASGDLEKAGAKTLYRGTTTCFDHQTVFVSSGKLKAYLGDVTPVVAEDCVGIDPLIHHLLVGALLEVRPMLSKQRDTVLLDFRSFVNQGGTVESKPLPDFGMISRQQGAMRVDIAYPEIDFHTLRGSIRIPLDKTVLVGGCTSAKMKDRKVLYLVVEVSASKDPREAAATETPKK